MFKSIGGSQMTMASNKDEILKDNEQLLLERKEDAISQPNYEGNVRVSEDVIAHLAMNALNTVEGVFPSNPGLMANLRLGRKTTNGIRVTISEADVPEIVIDAYVLVKYGLRIPDICWDLQESIKRQVEQTTGYQLKSVNIYVQGISFINKKTIESGLSDKDFTPVPLNGEL